MTKPRAVAPPVSHPLASPLAMKIRTKSATAMVLIVLIWRLR